MNERYGHLNLEERALIQASLKLGLSVRAIGRELDRAGLHHQPRTQALRLAWP